MPASASVGVEFLLKDAQFRNAMKAFRDYVTAEFRAIAAEGERSMPKAGSNGSVPRGGGGGSRPSGGGAPGDAAKTEAAAIAALEAQERKYQQMHAQYTGENRKQEKIKTAELVNEIKQRQDKNQQYLNAIAAADDKATRDHLRKMKNANAEELRLLKQVSIEKEDVQKGGAGGKIGQLGTGRSLTGGLAGALPGAGMLAAGPAGMVAAGAAALAAAAGAVINIGKEYEDSVAEMAAITGLPPEKMEKISAAARGIAKDVGGTAVDQMKSFSGIASRLGTEIADSPEAIERMGRAVSTLAAASGETAETSMDALTTSMLQFQVSLEDPVAASKEMDTMMNQLAKSAQLGAASIPQVSEAVTVAGSMMKGSNVSFEETNAAIQVIAKNAGKYGAEAGTGLRNVTGYLQKNSKEAKGLFTSLGGDFDMIGKKLTTEGLGAALDYMKGPMANLKDDAQKNAFMMQFFGVENAAVAQGLMDGTAQMNEWSAAMENTKSGEEQAAIRQATLSVAIEKGKAALSDIAITIYQAIAPALTLFVNIVSGVISVISTLIGWIIDAVKWYLEIYKAILDATGVTELLGKAWDWLKGIVAAVVDWFKRFIANISDSNSALRTKLQPAIDFVTKAFGWLKTAIGDVAHFIGKVLVGAFNVFMTPVRVVWGWIKALTDIVIGAYSWIGNIIGSIARWGASFFNLTGPIKAVIGALGEVIEWVKGAIDSIGSLFSSAGEGAKKLPAVKAPVTTGGGGTKTVLGSGTPTGTGGATIPGDAGGSTTATGAPIVAPPMQPKDTTPKEKPKTPEQIAKEKYDAEVTAAGIAHDRIQIALETAKEKSELTEITYERKRTQAAEAHHTALFDIARRYGSAFADEAARAELDAAKARNEANKAALAEYKYDQEKALEGQQAIWERELRAGRDVGEVKYERAIAERDILQATRAEAERLGLDTLEIQEALVSKQMQIANISSKMEDDLMKGALRAMKLRAKEIKDEIERATFEAVETYNIESGKLQRQLTALPETEFEKRQEINDAIETLEDQHQLRMEEIQTKAREKEYAATATFIGDVGKAIGEGNAAQVIAQKLGLDTNIKNLVQSKGIEAAIWIATEFQKTAATKAGVFERIGMVASEIWANIKSAASSVWTAASNMIKWIVTLIPWPWNLALIPAGIAGLYGIWKGAEALFKPKKELAEGGIAMRPIFSPLFPGGALAGEAGPEAIIPLRKMPEMIRAVHGTDGGMSTANLERQPQSIVTDLALRAALTTEAIGNGIVSAISDLVDRVNTQKTMIFDPYAARIAVEKDTANRNGGNY